MQRIISVIGGSESTPEHRALAEEVGRELAKRGVQSRMPPEVYTNVDYEWEYPEEEEAADQYKLV